MSGSVSTISFDEIPYDWRVPGSYVEVKPSYSNLGVLAYPARALLIGQKLAAGSSAVATPQRITRREQATALFGAGSVCDQMAKAFLDANATTELTVIAYADPSGTAAAGSFTIAGTATAAGTISVAIGDRRVTVSVASGSTAATVATALRAAINAVPDLPVTAAGTVGTVSITAKHVGTVGNSIPLRVNPNASDATPAGLTNTLVAMTSGAGTVDITACLTAVAADWYTDIAVAAADSTNLGVLVTDLIRRYAAMGKLDAHGYAGLAGTFGTLSAAGAALNSPFLTLAGANNSRSTPWQWAASLCGRAVYHLTNDPARQLRTISLPGIMAPDVASRFTPTEQDLLLRDGISTFDVDYDGTVRLSRVITTYQTSALGVADTAWLDITIPKTLSRIRYDWAGYLALNFPRHKLADDGSPAAEFGDAIATPRMLHGSWGARCTMYERLGWIEDAARTVGESLFQRDGTDRNRVNARQRVRIVGNLMVLAASLQFEA